MCAPSSPRSPPARGTLWHTHPPKLSYVVSGGTLCIRPEDGDAFLADESPGAASWMGALGRHYGQNVGDSPARSCSWR